MQQLEVTPVQVEAGVWRWKLLARHTFEVNGAGSPCAIANWDSWTSVPGAHATVMGTRVLLQLVGGANTTFTPIAASQAGSGSYNLITVTGSYRV